MTTFSIYELPYIRRARDRARSARDNATGSSTTEPIAMTHTASDSLTLRGIPAVGRGVSGHIAGTQPERAATR